MFNKEKRHFKRKLDGVQKMMWDLEFKKFKTREIREEIRVEYDGLRSRLEILQTKIKSEKESPTMSEGDIKRLDDQEVLLKRDIDRLTEQMNALDVEINGAEKSANYPDGHQGMKQQLDALEELKVMLQEYIKVI